MINKKTKLCHSKEKWIIDACTIPITILWTLNGVDIYNNTAKCE